LTTKSLDNIFARQLTYGAEEQGSPFLWRDATRSEEQLYHAPHAFPGATCPTNKASRFSGARYVEDSVFVLFILNFCRKELVLNMSFVFYLMNGFIICICGTVSFLTA
jgi:hypothetical protein